MIRNQRKDALIIYFPSSRAEQKHAPCQYANKLTSAYLNPQHSEIKHPVIIRKLFSLRTSAVYQTDVRPVRVDDLDDPYPGRGPDNTGSGRSFPRRV